MAFANTVLLPWVLEATYLARANSDHTPIQITLQLPDVKSPRTWRLQTGVEPVVTARLAGYGPTNTDSSTPKNCLGFL